MLTGGPFGFFTNEFVFPLAAKFRLPRVKRFIVERVPWKRIREIKEVVDVMHNTSLDIIQMKKEALNNTNPDAAKELLEKKDIISILSKPLYSFTSDPLTIQSSESKFYGRWSWSHDWWRSLWTGMLYWGDLVLFLMSIKVSYVEGIFRWHQKLRSW